MERTYKCAMGRTNQQRSMLNARSICKMLDRLISKNFLTFRENENVLEVIRCHTNWNVLPAWQCSSLFCQTLQRSIRIPQLWGGSVAFCVQPTLLFLIKVRFEWRSRCLSEQCSNLSGDTPIRVLLSATSSEELFSRYMIQILWERWKTILPTGILKDEFAVIFILYIGYGYLPG